MPIDSLIRRVFFIMWSCLTFHNVTILYRACQVVYVPENVFDMYIHSSILQVNTYFYALFSMGIIPDCWNLSRRVWFLTKIHIGFLSKKYMWNWCLTLVILVFFYRKTTKSFMSFNHMYKFKLYVIYRMSIVIHEINLSSMRKDISAHTMKQNVFKFTIKQ